MEEGEKGKVFGEGSGNPFIDPSGDARDREILAGEGATPDISGRGGIVTARGTLDGVVVRLDARVDKISLKEAVIEFLSHRKGFLSGNEVALEWVGARPDEALVSDLSNLLSSDYNITVKSSRLRESRPVVATEESGKSRSKTALDRVVPQVGHESSRALSLFDGMEVISESRLGPAASERGGEARSGALWDDPDARVIYSTLRSGQKIETDHTLVVFGDVNSGAEIIAGGDIIVLGTLRGVAHAGAYDETGGGRVILALNLQPTQLRIGMVISRGSADSHRGTEIARVEDGLIVVEPYQARSSAGRR